MSQLSKNQTKKKKCLLQSSIIETKYSKLIKSLILIGQSHVVTSYIKSNRLDELQKTLRSMEPLLKKMGGLSGFYKKIQKLLKSGPKTVSVKQPSVFESHSADGVSGIGLESLDQVCEFIVLGGRAQRFNKGRGKKVQALETFLGVSFIESLFQDIFAREYLHYQKFSFQLQTPVLLMSSPMHDNHQRVLKFLQENQFFGRRKLYCHVKAQPMVVSVNRDGDFHLNDEMRLEMRPAGHGCIWNLALESRVLDWLESYGIKYILARQINNLMSGLDHNILSFMGTGIKNEFDFGFACTDRVKGLSEGINLLKEVNGRLDLSCMEYCESQAHELDEELGYSNTNILFTTIRSVRDAVKKEAFTGLLLNFKGTVGARLESTMQMICDSIQGAKFLYRAPRRKFFSVIKRPKGSKEDFLESPQSFLYDLLHNHIDLLRNYCRSDVPDLGSIKDFLSRGPRFLLRYHPALGPTYDEIANKIEGVKIHEGSILDLQITQLSCKNLELKGSLGIYASCPMGHFNDVGSVVFSEQAARCYLENVKIDLEEEFRSLKECVNNPSQMPKCRIEIYLEEASSLTIKNISFTQPKTIRVRKGESLILED